MKYFSLILLALYLIMHSVSTPASSKEVEEIRVEKILRLKVSASINPAVLNYFRVALEQVRSDNHQLLLLELNTPGGLVSTTKEIIALFGDSPVPVVVWITPEGASATSAGAIIASGAHVLVMSGGTNIGAATPVQMGKDTGKDMRKKTVNDLVALVQSLAVERGRNGKKFGEMISKASSFEARKAKKSNLIDAIINTQSQLLDYLDGRTVRLKGTKYKMVIARGVEVVEFSMDTGQRLLNILANPMLAYILFLLGAALIYLELQAPGGLVAGSIGVLSLVVSAIGMQLLPLNFGALGLIILSFLLFVLEIYITSYGILSIAGLASLISGSLFLFRTDNSYIEFSHKFIFSTVAAIAVFILMIVLVIAKTRNKKGFTKKFNRLVGKQGEIVNVQNMESGRHCYQVKVAGEFWSAVSTTSLKIGDSCSVVGREDDNMRLKIDTVTSKETTNDDI